MKLYNNFLVQVINVFENFLEEKGIDIPNEDKLGDDGEAIIYGMDFGRLMEDIREICQANGIEVRDSWKV